MSRKVVLFFLSVVLVLATIFSAVPAPAFAQSKDGPLFGARPSDTTKAFFTFTLKPGESIDDKVLLVNNSKEMSLNLNILLVSGETGLTGGISFDKKKEGTASWITFPGDGDHALDAQKGLPLPFKITVPQGTPPGEYIAGFLVSNNADKPGDPSKATPVAGAGTGQGLAVQVIPRVATAIVITVPTPTNCSIDVTGVKTELEETYGRLKSTITMKSVGDLHYRGNFTYELLPVKDGSTADKPSYGEPVFTQKLYMDYFIPGDTMNYPVYLTGDKLPAAGKYHVNLVFEDGCKFNMTGSYDTTLDKKNVDSTTDNAKQLATQSAPGNQQTVEKMPAWAIYGGIALGVVLILLLLVIILLLVRRRKKDEDKDPLKYE